MTRSNYFQLKQQFWQGNYNHKKEVPFHCAGGMIELKLKFNLSNRYQIWYLSRNVGFD